MAEFDESELGIACDFLGENRFAEAEAYFRGVIRSEVYRRDRRRRVVTSILASSFGFPSVHPLDFRPMGDRPLHPLYFDLKVWLEEAHGLFHGLHVSILSQRHDRIPIRMHVEVGDRHFAVVGEIMIGQSVQRSLERCYQDLRSRLGPGLEIV